MSILNIYLYLIDEYTGKWRKKEKPRTEYGESLDGSGMLSIFFCFYKHTAQHQKFSKMYSAGFECVNNKTKNMHCILHTTGTLEVTHKSIFTRWFHFHGGAQVSVICVGAYFLSSKWWKSIDYRMYNRKKI